MTTIQRPADAPEARPVCRLYASPDHRVWPLNRTYIDATDTAWSWDGQPFDQVAGPEMTSPSFPFLHLPLIGLAVHCGLHSDTAKATAAGELAFQLHDAADAGYTPGDAS